LANPRFQTLPYRGQQANVQTLPYRGGTPNYRNLAVQFANQAGIDPRIFSAQISQESGFDPTARSGAGAIGIAQIVPKYHPDVDPTNPVEALRWAANDMAQNVRKYGSYQRALSVYNSGQPDKYRDPNFAGGQTYDYVRKIMSAAGQKGALPSGGVPSGGAPMNLAPLSGSPSFGPDPIASALISTLGRDPGEVNQALLGAALSPRAPSSPTSLSAVQPWSAASALPSAPRSLQSGKVTLAPGADRAGVSINPAVTSFVGQIAGLAGQPLQIGTGTNHSRLTVNGTESDHWTGNAADIPSSGKTLIQLGQDALIAAGMPEAQARQQTGGGYNVGPYQIIFNTDAPGWGNHFDHLHVGIRQR